MEEKRIQNEEEMQKVFQNLSEENKNVLNMVAKGMQIAQENRKESGVK